MPLTIREQTNPKMNMLQLTPFRHLAEVFESVEVDK